MGYRALRTERWQLIHYLELDDMDELYDLQKDPYELKNRIGDPDRPGIRAVRWQSRAVETFTFKCRNPRARYNPIIIEKRVLLVKPIEGV